MTNPSFERPKNSPMLYHSNGDATLSKANVRVSNYIPSDTTGTNIFLVSAPEQCTGAGEGMSTSNLSKTQFWLGTIGTIIAIVATACTATWAISNNVDEKVQRSRQEIMASGQYHKNELMTRMDKLDTRIDRFEDKVDRGFSETNSGINDLKILIRDKSD